MLYYLYADMIILIIWLFAWYSRKDLRKPMVWTGTLYAAFNIIAFGVWFVLSKFVHLGSPFVPGYFNPDTLFNLGRITGGLAIEDIIFMFIAGGIATWIYEYVMKKKISTRTNYKVHINAILWAFISYFIIAVILKANQIYPLIFATCIGTAVLWKERPDLIKHSLVGGVIFFGLYIITLKLFIILFPGFVATYNLSELSGFLILNIPIEELLYGLTFGLMWAPMYEYGHGVKIKKRR